MAVFIKKHKEETSLVFFFVLFFALIFMSRWFRFTIVKTTLPAIMVMQTFSSWRVADAHYLLIVNEPQQPQFFSIKGIKNGRACLIIQISFYLYLGFS
ncbi:hypothetical protein [Pseudocnuella soli]|uniref:hypothetical protein n=1 Tax=Pseudocnuella soli TaxID=2502779 RepID=UPI00104DA314|nr:hypothetical protein [Pseudocnuella soli]